MVKQSRLFDSKLQAENNRLRQRLNDLETTILEQRVREQTQALQQEINVLRSELKRYQRAADAPRDSAQPAQPPSNGEGSDSQKQAANLLQEWEQFIEHINDANPVVLYLYNFTENRVLYSNNEIAKLLGYSLDEIHQLGPNLFPELMHPDDASRLPAHLLALQDSSPGGVCEFEYRMKHKNGFWRWFYSRDVVTNRDAEGHPLEGIGIANEVTQRKLTEEKLRNQADLLQNVSDAIISTDADYRITQWNRSAEKIYGWKEQEVTGKRPSDLLKITFLNQTGDEVMKEFNAKGRWNGETRQVRKDGTPIYVHSSVARLFDAAGNFNGTAAINRDVTEQKRIQDALKMSEARFRTLIEKAPTAIGIARNGICIYANPRFLQLFGFDRTDELVGRPLIEQIAPQSREDVLERVRRRDQNQAAETEYESIGLRRDGSQFPFQVSVTRVELADGPATVALFTDISLRKQAEEALRAANRFNLEVINGAGEGVIVFDRELRYQTWNPFMEKLTGYQAAEVLNRKALEVFPFDEQQVHELGQVLAGKSFSSPDFSFKSPRMERAAWLSATYSPYLDVHGNVIGIICMVRDVTGRVQADMMRQEIEILRNMDRFRDELISNVSHEMRNPLGLILVMVTALLRNTASVDTTTLIEFLRDIEQETRNLQAIVDNLLDASRLQSGRMRLQRKPADLGKIVQRTVRLAQEQAAGHIIRHQLPEESLVTVMDPNRIEQVLKNILENAVKYSPPGAHIDVTVRINQGFYQVEVCDEGPGIQPGDRERIFERFYRGLDLNSNGVPGVGLGLPISRSIIEAHEGKLWAEARPAPETGSRFIFTLPIKIDPGSSNSGDWPDEP